MMNSQIVKPPSSAFDAVTSAWAAYHQAPMPAMQKTTKSAFIAVIVALFALLWTGIPAMAATLLPPGEVQFLDNNGAPLGGGSVYFYVPSTTTTKTTWQDSGQTVPNSNPVVLDAGGRAIVYGSGTYRMQVYSCPVANPGCTSLQGTLIYDQLTADPSAGTGGVQWGGSSGGTANSQTVVVSGFSQTDGQVIAFIAGGTNTSALTLTVSGGSPINVQKDTPTGPIAMTGGEVVANNVVELVYSASTAVFHLVNYNAMPSFSGITLNGVITPAALGGNTNNWAPAGFATAFAVRASASGAINVTGLAGGVSGRDVVINNVGTSNITLTAQDANSSAANRFLIPRPLVLRPNQSVSLNYDGTTNGWRSRTALVPEVIAAGFKNLKSQTTSNTQGTVTADELTVEDANGEAARLSTVSVTLDNTVSGVGGIDTGMVSNTTWYAEWILFNPTTNTVSGVLSTASAFGSVTLPAGYTMGARVGWWRTDGSVHWLRTVQFGRDAQYIIGTNPANAVIAGNGVAGTYSATTPTLVSVSLASFVPTTASVVAITADNDYKGGVTANLEIAPNTSWGGTNNGPRGTNGNSWPIDIDSAGHISSSARIVLETQAVAWAGSATGAAFGVLGWTDNLD